MHQKKGNLNVLIVVKFSFRKEVWRNTSCAIWTRVASDLARKQDREIAVTTFQPTQLSPVSNWSTVWTVLPTALFVYLPAMSHTSPVVKTRARPHRRVKSGYKSPSTIRNSKARRRLFNNLETLSEFYGMNTDQTQFVIQDFYNKYL